MGVMDIRPGAVLVSSALLADPNFERTLVLLLSVDEDGALGVILNRPSKMPVQHLIESWADAVSEPATFFHGGPCEPQAALAVGVLDGVPPDLGWQPMVGSIGLLDLDVLPDDFGSGLRRLRVYAGYAGWGSGQLEHEIDEGSWHVIQAAEDDLFDLHPDTLWGRLLRRQTGDLAFLSTRPTDASLN